MVVHVQDILIATIVLGMGWLLNGFLLNLVLTLKYPLKSHMSSTVLEPPNEVIPFRW